jgi:hypothetical protein
VVEHLPSKCEDLTSNPSTGKKKKTERKDVIKPQNLRKMEGEGKLYENTVLPSGSAVV